MGSISHGHIKIHPVKNVCLQTTLGISGYKNKLWFIKITSGYLIINVYCSESLLAIRIMDFRVGLFDG